MRSVFLLARHSRRGRFPVAGRRKRRANSRRRAAVRRRPPAVRSVPPRPGPFGRRCAPRRRQLLAHFVQSPVGRQCRRRNAAVHAPVAGPMLPPRSPACQTVSPPGALRARPVNKWLANGETRGRWRGRRACQVTFGTQRRHRDSQRKRIFNSVLSVALGDLGVSFWQPKSPGRALPLLDSGIGLCYPPFSSYRGPPGGITPPSPLKGRFRRVPLTPVGQERAVLSA